MLRRAFLVAFICVAPIPASAAVITYESGLCIQPVEFSFGVDPDECEKWKGNGGFIVAGWSPADDEPFSPLDYLAWGRDFSTWSEAGSVWSADSDEVQYGLVFGRPNDPFTLSAVSNFFGEGAYLDDSDGCPQPVEITSSKGGRVVIEPLAAPVERFCYSSSPQANNRGWVPWPWEKGRTSTSFAGSEWESIEWFTIGVPNYWLDPRPRYTFFSVESVHVVPEPSMLALLSTCAALGLLRQSRGTRQRRMKRR